MKKKKMLTLTLLFLTLLPLQLWSMSLPAVKITLHKKGRHYGARSLAPCVTAELNATTLMINISRFVGLAQVNIYDANGNVVLMYADVVDGDKIISQDVGELPAGTYTIVVTISNSVFVGTMSV